MISETFAPAPSSSLEIQRTAKGVSPGNTGVPASSGGAAQAQLADYPEVLERYTRYAPTQEELSLTDRMAVLDLIDQVIRPAAEISQVTIQDQQALVTFSGVTLVETAGLVAQLEQSELVAHTTVSTAASEDGRQNIVDVNLFIDLTTGEEAAP